MPKRNGEEEEGGASIPKGGEKKILGVKVGVSRLRDFALYPRIMHFAGLYPKEVSLFPLRLLPSFLFFKGEEKKEEQKIIEADGRLLPQIYNWRHGMAGVNSQIKTGATSRFF